MSSSSIAGCGRPGGSVPASRSCRYSSRHVRTSRRRSCSTGVAEEPLEPVRGRPPAARIRSRKIARKAGSLRMAYRPSIRRKRGDVLEKADLEAHRRDALVHQAPVRLGQLSRDDEVPAHEGPHHEEEARHGETELMAEAQRKAYGDGSCRRTRAVPSVSSFRDGAETIIANIAIRRHICPPSRARWAVTLAEIRDLDEPSRKDGSGKAVPGVRCSGLRRPRRRRPVIIAASSDARNSAVRATSSGVLSLPRGMVGRYFRRRSSSTCSLPENRGSIGVSVATGAIATARTPNGASSRARLFVRATTAPFEAE